MTLFIIIVGMGIITYAIRLSMILLWGQVAVSAVMQRALRFVPAAVLSAIIFPELLQPAGVLDISLGNGRLLAGAAAALVAWRTGNMLLTLAVGMGLLWSLQLVGS